MKRAYNISVVVLALISVAMAIADLAGATISATSWFYSLDSAILVLFAIDYLVRLIQAKQKGKFFVQNIFDLVAIIPFNAIFAVFRVFRIFRIARLAKLAKLTKFARVLGTGGRLKTRINAFLRTNGLIYIIYINLACILLGAVAIYFLEQGITVTTFWDAIWWAFVTATTVGYGDISPSTGAGRIVAAVLMLTGIGLVSMLTGTIATYFTSKELKSERDAKLDELRIHAASLPEERIDELLEQVKEESTSSAAK